MIKLLLVFLAFVHVEFLFDPDGDGRIDGLMWNTPVVAYRQGQPVAYAVTGRDSSVHLDLFPGSYRFRAWVKNTPVHTGGYWLCQKAVEIDDATYYVAVSCRHRYLKFMPLVGGHP